MPDPVASDAPDARQPRTHRPGIGARAAAVAGSFLDYVDARIRLAGLEAKEARGAVLRRAIAAAVGVFFLLIAYLGLVAGGVAWVVHHFDKPWYLVMLAAAGLHLFLGLLGFFYARQQFRESPFRDTRREFERDREWLNSMRPPKS